jgi:hypothetical protein
VAGDTAPPLHAVHSVLVRTSIVDANRFIMAAPPYTVS